MSSSPAARPLRLPPTDFDRIKIPKTRQPPRNWFRVHQSGYPAIFLSLNTAHRFSHKDSPYPFLYLGIDIETCLFERFGDETYDDQMAIAQSIWYEHSLSTVQIPEVHV